MALVSTRRCRTAGSRWLRLCLLWLCLSGLPVALLGAVLTEYEVKAGFLYHVGWFVDWPASTVQADASTFVIGVLGTSPFGGVLEDLLRGKSVRERPVVVQYYQRPDEAIASHVLFISAEEAARLPALLEGLGKASVLTVSDLERFTERGGVIALRLVDRKLHFDINLEAAERAGLKLSSQLLRLAKAVHPPQSGRK
ncbi:MAG: YfiR family protein [Candidatus Tectimicrobiota bacterium]